MKHDRYEMDILKALNRIASSLDKIEKKMPDILMPPNEQREKIGLDPVEEYDTVEYGKEHPEFIEKINKNIIIRQHMFAGNKREFDECSCSSLNRIAASADGNCVDSCDMECPYEDKED